MKKTFKQLIAISALATVALSATCAAEEQAPLGEKSDAVTQNTNGVYSVTPIFSQLIVHARPKEFNDVFENANATSYIREAVLAGETVNNWTQMITLGGNKGLATNPELTPKQLAQAMGQRFHTACPKSFTALALPPQKFNGHDAFVAIFGCGRSPSAFGKKSEMTLSITIKGLRDYYSIQWAERGDPSDTPIPVDLGKWLVRMGALSPIRLCINKPNDKTSYFRCLEGKE